MPHAVSGRDIPTFRTEEPSVASFLNAGFPRANLNTRWCHLRHSTIKHSRGFLRSLRIGSSIRGTEEKAVSQPTVKETDVTSPHWFKLSKGFYAKANRKTSTE